MSNARYGRLDRWLHRLALGSKTVRRIAFDLEKSFARPTQDTAATDCPVYICGLARSGTTMLLRVLDQAETFRSLSYRDMPFVMAPNLWKKLSRFGEREASLAERAHGDGILVGYDSPEAFEEVFWQSFDEPDGEPSTQTLEAFAEYRRLIVRPRGDRSDLRRRYLSKNNNNLMRLGSLCMESPATILLVYRDPVETARSLHKQHRQFSAAQKKDPFMLQYMQWLGHHEFGLAHKPFPFAAAAMNPSFRPEQPDYWLDYWQAVYTHVLTHKERQIRLAHHDSLRAEPEAFLTRLFALLGMQMDASVAALEIKSPEKAAPHADEFSPGLLDAAYRTYASLRERTDNILVSQHELQTT